MTGRFYIHLDDTLCLDLYNCPLRTCNFRLSRGYPFDLCRIPFFFISSDLLSQRRVFSVMKKKKKFLVKFTARYSLATSLSRQRMVFMYVIAARFKGNIKFISTCWNAALSFTNSFVGVLMRVGTCSQLRRGLPWLNR